MSINNTSQDKVNNFFKNLEYFKSHKIFVHTDKDSSIKHAKNSDNRIRKLSQIDGDLFAVKANIKVNSFPFHAGIEEFKNNTSSEDDPIIKIIKKNGGIIVGSTNMDEAAFGGQTSSSFYGRCLNPNNIKLSVGGSSGGSAASISSGLVDNAIGTDTMGSVRIPASYCGVFGFKPSSITINNKDLLLLSDTYDTIGFFGKNLFNINNIFNLINIRNKDYEMPQKINCIVPTQIFEDQINPDVLENFKKVIILLKSNNIEIIEKELDYWSPNTHRKGLLKIVENEGAKNLSNLLKNSQSKISNFLRSNLQFGQNIRKTDIERIKEDLFKVKTKTQNIFKNFDLMLTPTTPQSAFNIEKEQPLNQANFTSLANISDLPAISLPYKGNHKKPLSVQLMAANNNDKILLKISSIFEKILQ